MSVPCQQLKKVLIALCDEVASPVAHSVKLCVETEAWSELQKLKVSPNDYTDGEDYFLDALCTDFLRKCAMSTGVDTKAAAVKTFWECETQNAKTNTRLQRYLPHLLVLEDAADSAIVEFIDDWRKDIENVLKRLPDDLTPKFGGGSTYSDRGKLKTIPDKMSGSPSITAGALCFEPLWSNTAWCKSLMGSAPYASSPTVVRGNRFATAPKTGETDRGICIEPSFNVSYQLAAGSHIRNCLKWVIGIDLKLGQAVHRERAQASSFLDTDATVDLKNASDTICRVLPQLVLPRLWFEFLDSLRSHYTLINNRWVRLEKFSSMGNGFTFELESLIFVTLARTVVRKCGGDERRVSCYGDDLIVPKAYVKQLHAALKFFGFTANESKTFASGPFRESCGGDFFRGVPVRAYFLKELPNEPHHWIAIANGLYRAGHSGPSSVRRWLFIRRAHRAALDAIPSRIRGLTGPSWLGDLVVHNDDPSSWRIRSMIIDKENNSSPVPIVRTWSPVAEILSWDFWKPHTQLAAALYGLPSTGVSPRDGVSGYKESYAVLLRNDWTPQSMCR